jgi:hypothetical protein
LFIEVIAFEKSVDRVNAVKGIQSVTSEVVSGSDCNSPLGRLIAEVAIAIVFIVRHVSTGHTGCGSRVGSRIGLGTFARRLLRSGFAGHGLAALQSASSQIVVHGVMCISTSGDGKRINAEKMFK